MIILQINQLQNIGEGLDSIAQYEDAALTYDMKFIKTKLMHLKYYRNFYSYKKKTATITTYLRPCTKHDITTVNQILVSNKCKSE